MTETPKKKPEHPDRFFLNSGGLWLDKKKQRLMRVYSLQPWWENRKKYVEVGYVGDGCMGPFFQITTTNLARRAVYLEIPYWDKQQKQWVDQAKIRNAGKPAPTRLVAYRHKW